MAFSGQVDNSIDIVTLEHLFDSICIANVDVLEEVAKTAKLRFDISKVLGISCIGQLIEVDDASPKVGLPEKVLDEIRPDKAGTASY
jgi:hypothetical protein